MIGKTIHGLKIMSELGQGGMGTVYLAEHETLGKLAVKMLEPSLAKNPQARERFKKEAAAQIKLKHENIVHFNYYFEEGDNLFLVMEYVDGMSLDDYLRKHGKLSEDKTLLFAKDALRGLNYAHRQGVVHRDVKPSNILIASHSRAKIMDFGIALIYGSRRLTRTGSPIGTAWYMSPEQIKGKKDIDHRADVYSMGVVMYECLSGEPPFDSDTDYEIFKQHEYETPKPLTGVSPRLAELVFKALNKKPDDRYNGCGEFLACLEAYEVSLRRITEPDYRVRDAKETPIETPPFKESSRRREPKPSPFKNLALAALSILLIVMTVLYLSEKHGDSPPPPIITNETPTVDTSQDQPTTHSSQQTEKSDQDNSDISENSSPQPLNIYTEPTTNMTFIYIAGGSYTIGCGDWTSNCYDDENPTKEVELDGFWMGQYEVTVKQYMQFVHETDTHYPEWLETGSSYHIKTGSDGYYKKLGSALTSDNYPIVGVSWNDAEAYAKWLANKTGKTFQLPSEAQWEFACRSRGKEVKYGTKDGSLSPQLANYSKDDGFDYTAPVGSFPSNDVKLFAMSGNVWEWVQDAYDSNAYSSSLYTEKNPIYIEGGANRVIRGGSWYYGESYSRCANRFDDAPADRLFDVGFRLVRL